MLKVSASYASGLFHTYDVPGLPRTNNDRESEFRDLTRRLLITPEQVAKVKASYTGQYLKKVLRAA